MEQESWLKASWRITEKGRKAKLYEITKRGRAQLAAEKESWERLTRGVALVLRPC
jgi:DNA-binding PadR family transcriptional regulator